ncbi:MAG: hypothetical protein ACLUVA_09140 [Faecalibacterium sp.]
MVPSILPLRKEAGVPATDKAKLLSEISRYASGKCDQRVVGDLDQRVQPPCTTSCAAFWRISSAGPARVHFRCGGSLARAENAEHNTDYLYPVQEHNYRQSESESGLQRNEALQQYIEELGYSIDFKTSLAKLEKDADGRITGIIAREHRG